jgi:hypothetical protein
VDTGERSVVRLVRIDLESVLGVLGPVPGIAGEVAHY